MNTLTASLEDYLEIICNSSLAQEKIRAVDISRKLNISRASTTEALKKLSEKGFINYNRHEAISLTETGKKIAEKVVSKHTILQRFFEEVLNLSTEEASENACKIEHVITDNAFKQISKYLEKHQNL